MFAARVCRRRGAGHNSPSRSLKQKRPAHAGKVSRSAAHAALLFDRTFE
jgi:hypothetical protein